MTRLFLRFYLGVIAILLAAWLIQGTVFRKSTIEENIPVIERVYSSSARLARDQIIEGGEEKYDETIGYLRSRFDYPIGVVKRDDRPLNDVESRRLDRGESVLTHFGLLEIAIPNSPFLVELGPLPRFDAPSQAELTLGLGAVFTLTAIGIAILLRPVIVQLRSVERAALSIAGGDLDTRIEQRALKHSAPLLNAFNNMADRIQTLLGTQKEMLQLVSHELRTPLARIRFATELLRNTEDDAGAGPRIDAIEDATDQLDELVDELLVYVKLEADERAFATEEIDVRPLVNDLIDSHSPLHPDLRIRADLGEAPERFKGSTQEVSRALGNLIGNAAKYAEDQVEVRVDRFGESIRFVVGDDGPGIAPEDHAAIFEPFYRLSKAEGRGDIAPSGTGLGLALVKRITARLGGAVDVGKSPLGGAQFTLTFPLMPEQPVEA